MRTYLAIAAVLISSVAVCGRAGAEAEPASPLLVDVNVDKFGPLLQQVVTAKGLVRYDLLRRKRGELDQLAEQLGPARKFKSKDHELAFYINAYNLVVLHQVVDRWPVESVQATSGFFKKKKYTVNGRSLTLNDLENKVIRPLGDPRIHAALVCAAVSCPELLNDAYHAEKLDQQLTDITRRWLADPAKNTVKGNRLMLSKLFTWYSRDFKVKPYGNVYGFLKAHTDSNSALGILLLTSPKRPPISYLDYNWSLNAAPLPKENIAATG